MKSYLNFDGTGKVRVDGNITELLRELKAFAPGSRTVYMGHPVDHFTLTEVIGALTLVELYRANEIAEGKR